MESVEGHVVTFSPGYYRAAQISSEKTEIAGGDMFVEHFPPENNEPIFSIIRDDRRKIGEVTGRHADDTWQVEVSTS